MKVRSVTCFFNPSIERQQTLARLAEFTQTAQDRLQDAGFEVQTTRLSSVPFLYLLPGTEVRSVVNLARELEAAATNYGFAYLSLGPAYPALPASYEIIPEVLAATQNVFLSGIMADYEDGVSLPAVRACAQVIAQAAPVTPDGFTNLRFAALSGVEPFGPFFPGSFSAGEETGFALAVECADAAVDAFSQAGSLSEGRRRLLQRLEAAGAALEDVCSRLADEFRLNFYGLDFSLAPFPDDCCSIGAALELMGAPAAGLNGSLAAAAVLAETLDRGRWKRTGFNGLMLPVLEDSILARRSDEGLLTVNDLLMYSAVCGTGLDTVPLPGDASEEQLAAVLLDVAALSVRLHKPLTARLMPVPGKQAGERTEYDFSFFKNGRVLALPARAPQGFFSGDEVVEIRSRGKG
jgi:uncharacterized protein (UPF0210 family)